MGKQKNSTAGKAHLPQSKFDGKLLGLMSVYLLCYAAGMLGGIIGIAIFYALYVVAVTFFAGTAIELLLFILAILVLLFAVVMSTAVGIVIYQRWAVQHTCLSGFRLKFTGKAWNYAWLWVKWELLCMITLGIYSLWIPIKNTQWLVKNTCIDEERTWAEKPPYSYPAHYYEPVQYMEF